MEYISREDFCEDSCGIENREGYKTCKNCSLLNVPSADVQPIRLGRWIDIYEWAKMHNSTPSGIGLYYWCSECQKEQEKKSNFCPNCGTKMTKKQVRFYKRGGRIMANCKRCDRCRAYYEESDTFKKDIPKISKEKVKGFEATFLYSLGGNKIDFGKIDLKAKNGSWVGPIDLCPNCGEEFYKWLVNEEDNDGEQETETSEEEA